VLRVGYGIAMLGIAWLLYTTGDGGRRADQPFVCPCLVVHSERSHEDCPAGRRRKVRAAGGNVYRYCAHRLGLQRALSGAGALVAGLISTGVDEATLPSLVRLSRFPVPVAAATSTLVVAGTVLGASITHLVQLAIQGGYRAIPWTLIVWAVPGALVGAWIGTHFQGRVSERASRLFFSALFLVIGVVFLAAFTIFTRRIRVMIPGSGMLEAWTPHGGRHYNFSCGPRKG
jgi:uncharacterized membrane protein YfcA